MTTAAQEFNDLMPHIIRVYTPGKTNDYGRKTADTFREYRCLIDDEEATVTTATGTVVNVTSTAYVAPTPIGSSEVVDIKSEETVEIRNPKIEKRPVASIARHYDSENGVGMLHNIVLRFS